MGYAFAQVTPRGDRNFENHTISVVYAIDQGPRAYVERIEIRGNERTRDYVIRREFDVSEGDAFNQVLVQRAKRRLEALDFFEIGQYFDCAGLRAGPGHPGRRCRREVDRRILDRRRLYDRRRRSGPVVEGSITERNFLGRGQYIRFSAGGGRELARLHRFRSPSLISLGSVSRPASTSSAQTA